jgi:hypothetical protein
VPGPGTFAVYRALAAAGRGVAEARGVLDRYETRWAAGTARPLVAAGELARLAARRPVGLVTSNGRACVAVLRSRGLLPAGPWAATVTRDDCDALKPAAEPLVRAVRQLPSGGGPVWFVGDSGHDRDAATGYRRHRDDLRYLPVGAAGAGPLVARLLAAGPAEAGWGPLATGRRFVLTSDQDWAPEWALEYLLDWTERWRLPLHVFRTGPSPSLAAAAAAGRIRTGWHPNLAPGSSHGPDTAAVVAHLARTLPGAATARTHGFVESYQALTALAGAGVRFDSQFPAAYAGHLQPVVHASGIIRLPVWFEDDIWMRQRPDSVDIGPLLPGLHAPGLKIVNVHAVHLALNCPSVDYYEERRSSIYRSGSTIAGLAHAGKGVRDVVEALVDAARDDGAEWTAFEDLCAEAAALARSSPTLSPRFADTDEETVHVRD